MSCNITKGRLEGCKDSTAGIQGVYFENYDGAKSLLVDTSDQISGYTTAGATVYFYELKGANNYTETINTSRDNGTSFYTQTLTINLKKLTNDMTTQIKLLAAGRVRIYVHMNNGETLLMGKVKGADLTGGSIVSGSAMGDLYGYSGLVFTSMEKDAAKFVVGSTETDAFGTMLNKPTIVYA